MMAAALALLVSAGALAQPMMIDPSQMSGIPRPDPQVPAGTITVRLIRGKLTERVVGAAVELLAPDGKIATQKTDEEGRATFGGLQQPGPYQARASEEGETLTSQPIALQADMGSRVMLVFAPPGGAADGVARTDGKIPAGTIVVRAMNGDAPEAGLAVILGMARAGEGNAVKQYKGKTDEKGEARFDGLDAKPTSGYLAEVIKGSTRYASKPFRLQEGMGSRVTLDVRPVSHDTAALRIGPGSHFIFEVSDDVVQVVELWRLTNPTSEAIDPGPAGLHLSLPDKALQAQPGPQNPPGFTVNGHEAVLRGPIPPGDTELQVMFLLVYEGGKLDFVQRTPIPFADVAMVTEKLPGLTVSGNQLSPEERELQGRRLVLYRGPGTSAGGSIEFHLRGLPHNDPMWRYLAAAVTVALLVGFGLFALRGGGRRSDRERLEAERDRLLDELAMLPKVEGSTKHQELQARLVRLYRELDELP